MTFNVLWPAMRWPGDREIESSSVGDNQAIFCERYADVTDEQWASADAVVTVNDIPDEFREKLANCRIVVTPYLIYAHRWRVSKHSEGTLKCIALRWWQLVWICRKSFR